MKISLDLYQTKALNSTMWHFFSNYNCKIKHNWMNELTVITSHAINIRFLLLASVLQPYLCKRLVSEYVAFRYNYVYTFT